MFAVAVGYSLVTLGWHYPSDVLGGFLVAATWTLGVAAAYRVAEARWAEGTGREAALRLRDALTPPAVAAAGTGLLVAALVVLKPKPVLGYMAAHPAALTGALIIAMLGTVLATGLGLCCVARPGSRRAPTAARRPVRAAAEDEEQVREPVEVADDLGVELLARPQAARRSARRQTVRQTCICAAAACRLGARTS